MFATKQNNLIYLINIQEYMVKERSIKMAVYTTSKLVFSPTCDDKLIKQTKRLNLEIAIMNLNPVDYIRHEKS
jgi:hypothetical protein